MADLQEVPGRDLARAEIEALGYENPEPHLSLILTALGDAWPHGVGFKEYILASIDESKSDSMSRDEAGREYLKLYLHVTDQWPKCTAAKLANEGFDWDAFYQNHRNMGTAIAQHLPFMNVTQNAQTAQSTPPAADNAHAATSANSMEDVQEGSASQSPGTPPVAAKEDQGATANPNDSSKAEIEDIKPQMDNTK